jgi:uncharacterized membrane protein
MKEKKVITILFVIFLVAGLGIFFFSDSYNEFNFYESEITINGKQVTEKLYFKTDKPYHTLFRNFESPVIAKGESKTPINYMEVSNVECSEGEAYVRDSYGKCTYYRDNDNPIYCMPYTENKEYGCGFGNTYGFSSQREYWIESTYEIYPENIFIINGNKYIKFIAYSRDNHKELGKSNFKVNGNVIKKDKYSSRGDVIIYIPYDQEIQSVNTVYQKDFEFDKRGSKGILLLLLCLFPCLFIIGIWHFFGREHTYADIPPELSMYPRERKPWKIAAYFTLPFNMLDKNFFSAMLINLYHKKVIDIKMKKKTPWIKINDGKVSLDTIERNFLHIIQDLKHKKLENGFFDLKRDLSSFRNSMKVKGEFAQLQKDVKEQGKKFMDLKGNHAILIVFLVLMFVLQIPIMFVQNYFLMGLYGVLLLALGISSKTSPLFMRFKESYYKEYQHWRAFRKYLSKSFSITHRDHKGVLMWDHYLVYATALGVAKKVLKEMKRANIIDTNHYNLYTGVYASSGSFASSSGMSGSGGGAGGGGAGGGGGGGR